MSDTTAIGGVEIPVDALETLVERFDRDEIPEGSGAGVTTNVSGDGDTFGLFDDGDNDDAVRLKNLSEGETSRYKWWSSFEDQAEEALSTEPGTYLRAVSDDGGFGFEIPITADYAIEANGPDSSFNYKVAFDPDDNVDPELDTDGGAGGFAREHDFDGHANVDTIETVER